MAHGFYVVCHLGITGVDSQYPYYTVSSTLVYIMQDETRCVIGEVLADPISFTIFAMMFLYSTTSHIIVFFQLYHTKMGMI